MPTKWAPIKTIMFHEVQNKNRCFRDGLLRETKTFMFTKTQNLNNEKTEIRKRDWKNSKTRNQKETEKIDEKKPFASNILMSLLS